MGTDDVRDRYIAVTVEVDQEPLKEALMRLKRMGCISPETLEELSCVPWSHGNELVDLEFIRSPRSAACRVIMKPGKGLLDLLERDSGGG